MKRIRWMILSLFLISLIALWIEHEVNHLPGALWSGRDTVVGWSAGRYEILRGTSSYSLVRWQDRDGQLMPTTLTNSVLRYYLASSHAYIEANEGFMIINLSTHEYPSFSTYNELSVQNRMVFDTLELFQILIPKDMQTE